MSNNLKKIDSIYKINESIPTTAISLDKVLKDHISNYLNLKGNSTNTLPRDIKNFIYDLYKNEIEIARESENITLLNYIEKDLNKNTPSRTLIFDYYQRNQSICTRYINSIAMFFNQKYLVSEYNPASDFIEKYNLKT